MTSRTIIQRDALLAFGAFLVAFILWQFPAFSPVVYPLRLFVTLIHELGHGSAAILTGGQFIVFEVQPSGAGLAYTSGGFRPLVITSGYVGTAVFGAVLLYLANRVANPRWLSILLGIGVAFLTLGFTGVSLTNLSAFELLITIPILLVAGYIFAITDMNEKRWQYALYAFLGSLVVLLAFAARSNPLTVLVGVMSGFVLVVIGQRGDRDLNLFALNFVAFIVGLNAITDAWILLQIVSNPYIAVHNDAASMANEVAFSARFWAISWIMTAIMLFGLAVWLTFIRPLRKETGEVAVTQRITSARIEEEPDEIDFAQFAK